MKATLVLPDDLLREAKTLAVRRETILKALIEAALRREIRPSMEPENPDPSRFEVGPFGILRIRKASGSLPTTVAQVRAVEEALETEDRERMTHPQLPASKNLTDYFLLAPAVKHGGRFATFDTGINAALVPGGRAVLHVIPAS